MSPAAEPQAKKPAPTEPALQEPALQEPPARPEIVVLSFATSEVASKYEPISPEELTLLKGKPVAEWPIDMHVARSFAMQATRTNALCPYL